ncbi:MAG TPA: DNA gyrase subunit A [Armatimonadota bacterium]|nr:DNA gyrase subunit A [Armatimonadota bacterium]
MAKPKETLNVTDIDIEEEMRESFMTFAMSVIIARALPDVRDGLKPAQRRILYAMHDLNLTPGAQHRKCAKIAGDTSGNYHPHGQEVVYPTLARLAQEWNMRYRLVDGHGNFGSVDGDPPAAMRYTEARMSAFGAEMLADIDQETVDFVQNYDQTRTEPTVLPGMFPNLLCNGGSGIAVGMATNMPPHNLGEVVDACALMADDPDASLDDIMAVLPGPDFPTGALILGTSGIREAYESGRGSIRMQARAVIEPMDGSRNAILVTELPYQVNKANLVEQIAELVNNKRIEGISNLRDESDRKGMRVVIELKREANPHVVLNQLYKHTRMRSTFPINAVGLIPEFGAQKPDQPVPLVPRTLGIKELIVHFLDHRREVVVLRCQHQLERAQARAHILEGYRVALKNLDAVIKIIRQAENPPDAREKLMNRFKLSEKQAQAILELMLQRLTSLEREKIDEEYREVIKTIGRLEDILGKRLSDLVGEEDGRELTREWLRKNEWQPRKVMQIVKSELVDLAKKRGDERRTEIRREEAEDISIEDLIAEEDMVITMTRDGYIKRLPVATYRTQIRGGKGVIGLSPKEEDVVDHLFVASTHTYLLFFTNQGKVYRLRVHEVPLASRQARGTAVINLIQIESGEVVSAVRAIRKFREDRYLFMATRKGVVKKTRLSEYDTRLKGGIIALTLRKGDELDWVLESDGTKNVFIATAKGQSIRFSEDEVRPMGRSAAGVRGIRLRKGDTVIGVGMARESADLLVAAEHGYGKRTDLEEYRSQSRGGIGIKTMNVTPKTGPVVGMRIVDDNDDLLIITTSGTIIRQRVAKIRRIGRSTQGVRLIRLDKGDQVASIARVVRRDEGEDEGD